LSLTREPDAPIGVFARTAEIVNMGGAHKLIVAPCAEDRGLRDGEFACEPLSLLRMIIPSSNMAPRLLAAVVARVPPAGLTASRLRDSRAPSADHDR